MKRLFLTFALITAVFTISARQLSPTEALDRAIGASRTSRAIMPESGHKLVYTASDSLVRPMAYVFASGEDRGYMVVSADDVAVPVLAYSDSGTFDASSMPDNMRWWLEEYARQIAWASDRADIDFDSSAYAAASVSDRPYRAPVAPIVTTHWNQDSPFNNLCPRYNNTRCMTGCVATAMAQVMNYHKWPKQGIGSHTYTTTTYGMSIGWNFETTVFDWDNMLDDYTSTASGAAKSAVATLMGAVGVAVEMNYTTNASGAQSSKVAPALRDYFNYDDATTYRHREWYGLIEWENMIYDEIVNVGPVYYDGANSASGHAFVCDGYSSDGYFHFNWGWGGMSDGYFRLTALDPASQGIGGSTAGYSWNQGILTGAQPPQAGSMPVYVFGRTGGVLLCQDSNPTLGYNVTITGGFFNVSGRDIPEGTSVSFGLSAVNTSTGAVTYLTSTNVVDYSGGIAMTAGFKTFNVTLPKTLAVGQYEVESVFSIDGGEWQKMVNYKTFYDSKLYMTVGNGKAKFTHVKPGFKVTDIETSDLYQWSQYRISGEFSNPGDQEFHAGICGVFIPVGQSPTEILYASAAVGRVMALDYMPGESGTLTYISDFYTASEDFVPGEYDFVLIDYDGFRYNVYRPYSDPVRVTVGQPLNESPGLSLDSWSIDNAAAVDPDNIWFNMVVSGTSGIYSGPLTVAIYTVNGNQAGSYITQMNSHNVFICKGDTEEVCFSVSFPDGVAGTTYCAIPFCYIDGWVQLSNPKAFIVGERSGIAEVDAESPAAVEYFNLQGMPVAAGDLRHGQIYIRREGGQVSKIVY